MWKFLINEGADVNIENNEGKTAYDVAVELEYEECIEILESEAGEILNCVQNNN
jgi:ankyrin repeat protein